MAQNIYDDERFFAGYSALPRSLHGLAGAPEWPALQAAFERWLDPANFDADGRQLITGGQDGAVTLWSMPEPALAQR